jgi:hypothetical protein
MKRSIKAVLAGAVGTALLVVATTVWAGGGSYELTAPSDMDFQCGGGTYNHTLDTVSNYNDGTFDGTGSYDSNSSYTWDIDGSIVGNSITFHLVYTGSNAGYTLNGNGTIALDGSVSGTTDGNCQTFSMPAGTAVVQRYALITSPDEGEEVSGDVTFEAYLHDNDADGIQWAVRQGTCAAGVGTVFGNVDGHSDSATIDQSDVEHQTFSFTADMSSLTPGMYCFIYNPREDSGESDIRLTRQFELVEEEVLGCTDENATNYNSEATTEDGSCLYTPTEVSQCKDGGWMNYNNPEFKNQGDCVSWFKADENAVGNRKDNVTVEE